MRVNREKKYSIHTLGIATSIMITYNLFNVQCKCKNRSYNDGSTSCADQKNKSNGVRADAFALSVYKW